VNSASGPRKVGLARALSKLGYCSRSEAVERIRAGRVLLNEVVRTDPETPVHLEKDRLKVDGKPVAETTKVYQMLNKPRGIVTTASDEKGRKTVYAYLQAESRWLAPVGRLDKASEGLLLFTNDSEWAAQVLAPETHLEKTYHVQVGTVASAELIEALLKGVATNEGEVLRAKRARVLRGGGRNTWLEVVLDEGKNRHIRRMLKQLEVDVLRLMRVSIGPLALGELAKGTIRSLTEEEKHALDASISAAPGRKRH